MFKHIFTFELRYWLRQPMVYIFLLINVLLFTWSTASDDVTIGGSFGNIYKNAPYVIQNQFGVWCLFALMMTTAFVQSAAIRDFDYNTHQIVFSSPINKLAYLFGRFFGSIVVALIPFLGISLGILLGTLIGQLTGSVEPERLGPFNLMAHVNSFLIFAIPNTLIAGAFVFMLAALTRSTLISFVGSIVLLVGYLIANSFLADVENERLAFFVDTFGARPFDLITKYWTVIEKNTQSVGLSNPDMLLNRAIWVGVAVLMMVFTYFRFSFAERNSRKKRKMTAAIEMVKSSFSPLQPLPQVQLNFGPLAQITQFWRITRTDFWGTIKGTAFIAILLAGALNMGFSLQYSDQSAYGLGSYPVTYHVIDVIRGTMFLFLISIVVFYSGMIIWKERDANLDQIYNSLPHRTWTMFAAKLVAMIGIVAVVLAACMVAGVVTQALKGYTNFEIGLYLKEFFVVDLLRFIPLIALSMLVHTLVNNKYLAFFIFIAILITNGYVWRTMDVESNLVQFNGSPSYVYSDMNGYGPFVTAYVWFRVYWLLFVGLLSMTAIFFWVRGRDTAWKDRLKNAKLAFKGTERGLTFGILAAFVACGGFIFYNTKILNKYTTTKDQE